MKSPGVVHHQQQKVNLYNLQSYSILITLCGGAQGYIRRYWISLSFAHWNWKIYRINVKVTSFFLSLALLPLSTPSNSTLNIFEVALPVTSSRCTSLDVRCCLAGFHRVCVSLCCTWNHHRATLAWCVIYLPHCCWNTITLLCLDWWRDQKSPGSMYCKCLSNVRLV